MARVDNSRDYYADLELGIGASAEDVKKQYRKLVLKWHPDRNPGRGDEVKTKFQLIQSAYEILTDESLKTQYDNARKKSGRASGVKGNPWSTAGSEYPRPPQRTPAASTASHARPAASGADRYSDFTKTAPRAGKNQRDDPKTAQWNYKAWDSMRPNSQRRANNPPPTPGRAPTSATRDSKASDSDAPPKTASQKQRAQASFGSSTRRPGFTPRSTGIGDEPPVTNKNYYTTRTHTNIFTEASASAARQNQQESVPPDPLAQFEENLDSRQKTQYATSGGEKTSLFAEPNLGRAKSTRIPPRKPVPESPGSFQFAQQRARSSSTPRSSSNDGGSEDSVKVNYGVSSGGRQSSTNNRTHPSERYKPKPDLPNRTPAPESTEGPQMASSDFTFTTNGTSGKANGGTSTYAKLSNAPSLFSPQPWYPHAQKVSASSTAAKAIDWAAKISAPYRHSSSSGVAKADYSALTPIEKMLKNNMAHLINKKQGATLGNRTGKPLGGTGDMPFDLSRENFEANTDTYLPTSFNFTSEQGTPATPASSKRFASSSAENINTQFVGDDHAQEWEFKAGNASGNESTTPGPKLRSQSGSRLGRRTSNRPTGQTQPPMAPTTNIPPTQDAASEATMKAGFSPGEWSEKIASHHFVPQPHSASASPTRRANSRKNSKPVKMTMGTAGMVDEESSSWEGWNQTQRPTSGVESPMAMDIDTPPLEKADDTPKASQANGVRNIPVEPSRPEWRAGSVKGDAQPQPARAVPPVPSTETSDVPYAEKAAPQATSYNAANPFANPNGGSEDSEEFRTNFADFKKVEPFTDPVATGLHSFADLKTTLPFESRSSEHVALGQGDATTPLSFPTAPVAPRLPPTMGVPSIRINHSQWRKYAQDFYNYMDKWEAFHQKVLDHFSARQTKYIERRQQYGRTWLDTAPNLDAASIYLSELEQDQDVRAKWSKACEEHKARVREFTLIRDRAK